MPLQIGPTIGLTLGPFIGLVGQSTTVTPTTLTVSISDSADPIISSSTLTYTVSVSNVGAATANTIVVVVTLDSSLTFVSASGTDWTCNNVSGTVTCTRSSIAIGAAPNITVTVTTAAASSTETTTVTADASNSDLVNDSEDTVVLLVPKDVTSGKRVPLAQVDWDNVFTFAGVSGKTVNQSWSFQDASGNIVKTIGTDLTVTGTFEYNNAVSGWSRTGVQFTNASTDRAELASGTGPNHATGSVLWFGYIIADTTSSTTRRMMVASNVASGTLVTRIAGPLVRLTSDALSTDGASNPNGQVRPYFLRYNRTAGTTKVLTDQEVIAGTYTGLGLTGSKGFGATSGSGTAPDMRVLLGAAFSGVHAEWSDADIKAVMLVLGYSPPW